ncbi:MAG: UDP-N-acetyl-alpha-D-glucosamine C6 dehydratase [Bacteroidia bacterium]|nr:UDP-N-acetyl-alpha-D-glucosamine C6 dehydratase [Bacteroidia bacterium]
MLAKLGIYGKLIYLSLTHPIKPMIFFSSNTTPRWIIFITDIFYSAVSLYFAYTLRFNFHIPNREIDTFIYVFPFALGVRALSFAIGKIYAGVIRYTSASDAARILFVVLAGSIFFYAANWVSLFFINERFIIPTSVIFIDFFVLSITLTSVRLGAKTLYFWLTNKSKTKVNVIIFGAGESGIITKRTLDRDAGTRYSVLAFVDDDRKKINTRLEGVTIYHTSELPQLLKRNQVARLILSPQKLSATRKSEIIETCLGYDIKILNVPPVSDWINGELSYRQMKGINIDDLLGREPINLNAGSISKKIKDKTVLVTGAAGSIGSELVKQISSYAPKQLLLLDNAESPLYELEVELKEKLKLENFEVILCDVREQQRMEKVFSSFKIDMVFHAAAYKHVPMMEKNPAEAVAVNIQGTKIAADLAVKYGVKEFVMISTDKAVNPTNVMGASKRIAEIYTRSLTPALSKGEGEKTRFVTTRFGNVLGSNGSVIPFFKKQIESGGPVTVTHPEITRYFMTIPEAVQLVLEASAMGKGGEIFVFDMGKSVKIADLARKMIQLYKLTIDKDIKIVYTGLRPGEKLYEELLNNEENTLPTHHPQILIGKVKEYEFAQVSKDVDELIALTETQDNQRIVTKMKQMVPEFISNNSEFEALDKRN